MSKIYLIKVDLLFELSFWTTDVQLKRLAYNSRSRGL